MELQAAVVWAWRWETSVLEWLAKCGAVFHICTICTVCPAKSDFQPRQAGLCSMRVAQIVTWRVHFPTSYHHSHEQQSPKPPESLLVVGISTHHQLYADASCLLALFAPNHYLTTAKCHHWQSCMPWSFPLVTVRSHSCTLVY